MSFPTVMSMSGQVIKVTDTTEHALVQAQEGGDGRLTRAAPGLAGQIAPVLASLNTVTPMTNEHAFGQIRSERIPSGFPGKPPNIVPPRGMPRPPSVPAERKMPAPSPSGEKPGWEQWVDSLKNRGEKPTGSGRAYGNRGTQSGGTSQRLEFGR